MRSLLLIVLFLLFTTSSGIFAQDSISTDGTKTPFRKGRWLTGISGSINSITNDPKSTVDQTSSNEYAISVVGGNFFQDRWLVGGIIQMNRSNAEGLADLTNETFFIGPLVSRYLLEADYGSLYLSLAPGYARYRNVVRFTAGIEDNEEESEGSGFGISIELGYSYVVFDRIAFDIGVGLTQRWLNVERTFQPDDIVFSDDINLRNISFTFGFRVLLDKFLQ